MVDNEFTTWDVMKALNLHRERLNRWLMGGFIPVSKRAYGQGDKSLFSREDVYLTNLFKRLIDVGIKRETARDFIFHLKGHYESKEIRKKKLRGIDKKKIYKFYHEHYSDFEMASLPLDVAEVVGARFLQNENTMEAFYSIAQNPEKIQIFYQAWPEGKLIHPGELSKNWDIELRVNWRKLKEETDLILEKLKLR